MSKMKFTPGPYRADGRLIYGPDGMIAEVGFGMVGDDEALATAVLMAESPAMYAILERLVYMVGPDEVDAVAGRELLARIDRDGRAVG